MLKGHQEGGEYGRLIAALFTTGLVLSLVMLWRGQVAGDALALLTRGWLLAEPGIWIPFGNPIASTAGGQLPGGLTALLVGGPLFVWMDHRAPVVLILAGHIVAYVLLDRVVASALGSRARVLLAILYWLNPWRLYQSAWLDNSNYMFIAGAVHAWTTYRQRLTASWLHSALLVFVVGLSAQLHLCAMILVFASAFLWLRGYWKPHWGGVALGVGLTLATLIPYLLEVRDWPNLMVGGGSNSLGTGLLLVWPVFKCIAYWLRYPSLAATAGMNGYDFTGSLGASADSVLAPTFTALGRFVALVTVIPVLLANIWALRRHRRTARSAPAGEISKRAWLRGYALWVFVGSFVANALSPSIIMWWHNLIIVHAAVLPLLLWVDTLLRSRRAVTVRRLGAGWITFTLLLLTGMSIGAEQYRNGGRNAWGWTLPRNDQAVRDLRLTDYGVSVDPATGEFPLNNGYLYGKYMGPFVLPLDE